MPENVCCPGGGFCPQGMKCAKDSKGKQICTDPERIYCPEGGHCANGTLCCSDAEGKPICITVFSQISEFCI